MAEAVGRTRDEELTLYVSMLLLTGSVLLFFLMLPNVLRHETHFSPWIYAPGLLAMFLGIGKRLDAIAWLSIAWLSLFFMFDLFFGISLFG